MKYALLIYHNEAENASMTPDEGQALINAYFAYGKELEAAEVPSIGDALHGTSTATSVRVRNGEMITVDGPFAETKEQLGGFYIVDVENLDEALAWAAKIPDAKNGTIEVRPVMSFG